VEDEGEEQGKKGISDDDPFYKLAPSVIKRTTTTKV
jgi:hypothetical protein